MTSREATPKCSLSLVPWDGVTGFPRLLAEDENTSLAGKADFLYLPVLSKQQGIIGGLGAAVFPPALGFGNNLLAFLTVALFPWISKRYSPAFNSDLPSFALCEMLMVLAKGFANAGTASAMAASKATLRTNEFVFMRVNFLSDRIESAAQQAAIG